MARPPKSLGSAKEGVGHWWLQRLTALALIPLTLWFVASLVAHAGADHAAFLAWASSPVVFALAFALLVACFWHLALGLQTVIEDYVHGPKSKFLLLLLVKFGCIALGLAGTVALIVIAFGD